MTADVGSIQKRVEELESASPKGNRTGRWIRQYVDDAYTLNKCSECGSVFVMRRDVCPSCFASMEED